MSKSKSVQTNENDINLARIDVPSTNELQQRILKATEDMPQLSSSSIQAQNASSSLRQIFSWVSSKSLSRNTGLVAFASVAVALVIFNFTDIENSSNQTPALVTVQQDPSESNAEVLNATFGVDQHNLDWHDLSIMQDELAFAGL